MDEALIQMLVRDNQRMRKAGCQLAEAALRVVRDYDGIHRLSLAVAEWAKAVADEGDRPHELPQATLARNVLADRAEGMSLRHLARKHNIGMGRVRGILERGDPA